MKYAFARKFDVSPVRGVGAVNRGVGAVDPDDVVEISRAKLAIGGVTCALGGVVLGVGLKTKGLLAAFPYIAYASTTSIVGPIAIVGGGVLVVLGYMTLGKSYSKPELGA